MMHKAWRSIEEVPYCFSRSSVKLQGHTALKIVEFDLNWAFPDCNSSLNSPMAMKCCTNLETAKERCPIVFQVHSLNFKVTQDKTSPILTQIGRLWTIGRSQLSNPSDLPCFKHTVYFMIWYLKHLWNCSWVNATEPDWSLVNIGSNNGLVLSANKPLPELTLTQIYVFIEQIMHSPFHKKCLWSWLCFVLHMVWGCLFYPYPSGLCYWHWSIHCE